MPKRISAAAAKEIVLDKIAAGSKVIPAMQSVDRTYETYRDWRKNDPDFKAKTARLREALDLGQKATSEVPDFPEFCARYLKKPLPEHHLRAWDVMCGREPRDFHDQMTYTPGAEPGRFMILNFPPDHAKSTVWNSEYVVWRIHRNPNIRIITISKSLRMAKKFLGQVKFMLTSPTYREMHAAFAPAGGWRSQDKGSSLAWRDEMIYVSNRTEAEKDPTVESLGIGGHIYGSRADLVICDDIADLSSAGQYESQAAYISQDVFSRLDKAHGQLVILGTRVGPMDIYRHLRENALTEDAEAFYSYFAQPAILEGEHGHSSTWKVLWPERLGPKAISQAKAAMTDRRRFEFVYQQRDVTDSASFPAAAVDASINRQRFHGPMVPGATGHRPQGMQGLYVIGSWDPASSAGHNAMIVLGTDKLSRKRWIIDVWDKKGAVPRETIGLLKEWTVRYNIREWRIEKNAVQEFIVQLDEIRDFLAVRGVRLSPHNTQRNKWDADLGVEGALVPLFLSCVDDIDGRLVAKPDGYGKIELPSPRNCPAVAELASQLKSWEPENKRQIQDLVMALWFAELGVREYLRGSLGDRTHMPSRYTPRDKLATQASFTMDELFGSGLVHAYGS